MGESKMPAKIWITMEDHPASWAGSFRRWHASDLDHGDEYPTYTRADLVEPLVEALRRSREAVNAVVLSTHSVSFDADLRAIDAALSSWEAAQ